MELGNRLAISSHKHEDKKRRQIHTGDYSILSIFGYRKQFYYMKLISNIEFFSCFFSCFFFMFFFMFFFHVLEHSDGLSLALSIPKESLNLKCFPSCRLIPSLYMCTGNFSCSLLSCLWGIHIFLWLLKARSLFIAFFICWHFCNDSLRAGKLSVYTMEGKLLYI